MYKEIIKKIKLLVKERDYYKDKYIETKAILDATMKELNKAKDQSNIFHDIKNFRAEVSE